MREFLLWCTVINAAILTVSFFSYTLARGFIRKVHGNLFNLPGESIDAMVYNMLGVYKILIIFFNAVPYLALVITG